MGEHEVYEFEFWRLGFAYVHSFQLVECGVGDCVHGWDLSAPSNPTHHSGVERRNRVMEHFLDVGISNVDITSPAALERYCAAATATCNLEYETTDTPSLST